MQDLDYKDLFRDAIHTIAYIARAAGFNPNDPTVEPPAIIARIENQRAALERLTAERAALLAPVEGVDLEEVLADAETLAYGRKRNTFDPFTAEGSLLLEALADAAPALAREVAALRAAIRFADEQGTETIECVSAAIVADKWSATAAFQERALKAEAEVARLRADLDEARLTLAAEQGRAEGAPSEGWTYTDGFYERWEKGKAVVQNLPPLGWKWRIGRRKFRDAPTARAAMLAADAATEAR